MTKAEIVNEIVNKTGIEKVAVEATVEALMGTIMKVPAHHIPAFKPAKEFVTEVKSRVKMK